MSDTTTWSEESIEESLNAIIMETLPSQQQYYLNDDYFDIDVDEILNFTSPPGSPKENTNNTEEENTENPQMVTTMSTTITTTTATITTHSMSTTTATTTPTTSTSTSTSTTMQEDPTMDTNEDQAITREARAKASKDCLKALLVLRTPRPAETAPSNIQQLFNEFGCLY